MTNPKEITREYKLEDAVMFELAQTKLRFFIEDKADFIAFDPAFSDPFIKTWQTAISAAETFLSDDAIIDQLAQKTEQVNDKMNKCRDHFQFAKYFIEKTFPDNVAVWNEFGYNNYEEARNRQTKMVELMQIFYLVAERYKAKLIAAGYTQAKITAIDTLRSELNTANLEQEHFKASRNVMAQDRIKLLNTVWNLSVEKVCRAGKLIYSNNFAKHSRYLLPSEQSELPKEATTEKVNVV